MAEITKPDMTNLWANAGAVVAPSNTKIEQGWTAEIPPHQWENFAQNRQDRGLAYLFQRGIAEWDSTTEYFANRSVVIHNGVSFMATVNNVGQEPTGDDPWRVFALERIVSSPTIDKTGVGTMVSPIQLNVNLSENPSNRLRLYPDGLGVIDEAPASVAVQFIDAVAGDDNNEGSITSPLKTIKKALEKIAAGGGFGSYSIIYKAGQTHKINGPIPALNNASLFFSVYDDPIYGNVLWDGSGAPGYTASYAPDFSRPILEWETYVQAGFTLTPTIIARTISVGATEFHSPLNSPNYPGASYYLLQGLNELGLSGCNFVARHSSSYLYRGPLNRLFSFNLTYTIPGENWLTDALNSYSEISNDNDYTGTYSSPGYPTFVGRTTNARSQLTPANYAIHAAYDATVKARFGWDVGWDIFA